ncbi:MAG: sigma-70 family RNA polymerase sigma factor [Pyrinomonadaceae bacterium]
MPGHPLETLLQDLYSANPQDAWAEFLSEFAPVIYQVVRRFESDADNAADCFQFVCEQLINNRAKRLRKFKGNGPATFTTWLRAVVRNLCIDWHRKRFGRKRPFSAISRLAPFDQEVFRILYEWALPTNECLALLRSTFSNTTATRINESRERIEAVLTTNQRWLLTQRAANMNGNAASNSDVEALVRNLADTQQVNPEILAIENERRRRVTQAMAKLSPKERLLIRLRFEEGVTLDKVAGLLGLGNAQRADRQIKEILGRLRKLIGD